MSFNQFTGFFKINIKTAVAYRFNFAVWGFLSIMYLLIHYFLWNAVYSFTSQEIIRGFTFNGLIVYFLIISIVGTATYTEVDSMLARRIRSGNLSVFLARPISYMKRGFYLTLANRTFAIVLEKIPLVIVAAFLIDLSALKLSNGVLFSVSLIFAMALAFLISFTIGIISFWVKKYSGIRYVKDSLQQVLQGSWMPLAFFPQIIQNGLDYIPFPYIAYYPAQIFLGNLPTTKILQVFFMQIFWIVLLLFISALFWKKAINKFSGAGA
jgi:ABC-2 type transport system permease protein